MDNQKSKYRKIIDDWMQSHGLTFENDKYIYGTLLSFIQFLECRGWISSGDSLKEPNRTAKG